MLILWEKFQNYWGMGTGRSWGTRAEPYIWRCRNRKLMNFLRLKGDVSRENKLRLLMIYAAVYPEMFDDGKITELMDVARLSQDDRIAVYNLRLLEASSDTKRSSSNLDVHKKKHAARRDRYGKNVALQFSRFYPIIEELVEQLSEGNYHRMTIHV